MAEVEKSLEDLVYQHSAFEVIDADGRRYAVYANGTIEGFKQPAIIINYIPPILSAYTELRRSREDRK